MSLWALLKSTKQNNTYITSVEQPTTQKKMTRSYKISQTTLNRQYKQHGEICKLITTMSMKQVAEIVGLNWKTVSYILRKFGKPVGYKEARGGFRASLVKEKKPVVEKPKPVVKIAPVVVKTENLPKQKALLLKCKIGGCMDDRCFAGLCAKHNEEKKSANQWSGRLRMGKRLTTIQKRHAEAVGTFIEPVRVFGKV